MRRDAWRSCLAIAIAATLASPASAADTPSTSARRIKADVEALAAPELKGRRAGTPEGNAAAQYVADAFRKVGLLPGGQLGSYFQTFDFIDGVDLGPNNELSTGTSPVGRRHTVGTDYRPLAFSAAGKVSGEVVFAGYGISSKELGYDDYAGLDAKGKVVLVLRHGPDGDAPQSPFVPYTPLRYKATVARDKGAAALLVASPMAKGPDDLVALRTDASFSDAGIVVLSVKRPVAESLFTGSGKTLEEAQRAIDETRKPAPLALSSRASIVADVMPRKSKASNVIGILPGGDPARNTEVFVVGAHYDHLGVGGPGSLEGSEGRLHPGADDNASGIAALLEVARTLVPRRATYPRSTLFIAFGAEEEGTLGSAHFTKEPTIPLPKIVAMANLDMVGRLREDKLEVHGVGTSPVWRPLVEKANAATKLKLAFHEGGWGPSDQSSFYAVQKPVLFLFTGTHPDYHRSSDTAEKINVAGIERIVRFLTPAIEGVLRAAEPPAFTPVAGDKRPLPASPGSIRAWAGTIPDYSAEGDGLMLSGVWPGSPAERAGLSRGDVLVKLGDRQIKNIYDYTYAMQEHEPGETVRAVVRRTESGKTTTRDVDLTLSVRPSAPR